MQLLDDAKDQAEHVKDRLTRPEWVRHVMRAWAQYQENRGDQYAAAITYFSFLALFPLILLIVSVVGFVLKSDPTLQAKLFDSIAKNMPGGLGSTVKDSIKAAINARAGVGLIGLLGVLLTGLGWINNLRSAIEGVWGSEPIKRGFIKTKVANAIVLVVLGLASVISLGFTAVGTSLTDQILSALNLKDVGGLHYLIKVLGIALGIAGDMLIFSWLLVRLPRTPVRGRIVLAGALLASVGFEILKVGGTYYIARITSKPTVGIFGSVIGILVWINLVSRFLLFCAAWIASSNEAIAVMAAMGRSTREAALVPVPPPPPAEPETEPISSAGVAGSLFGAGVAVGGGVALIAAHSRRHRGGVNGVRAAGGSRGHRQRREAHQPG